VCIIHKNTWTSNTHWVSILNSWTRSARTDKDNEDSALTAIVTEDPKGISAKVLALSGSERAAYTFESGAIVSDLVAKIKDRWGATTFKSDDDVPIDYGDALGLWNRITIIVTQDLCATPGHRDHLRDSECKPCARIQHVQLCKQGSDCGFCHHEDHFPWSKPATKRNPKRRTGYRQRALGDVEHPWSHQ